VEVPLRAPAAPGEYGLRWDMVHTGFGAFSRTEGEVTFDKRVQVVPFQLSRSKVTIVAGRAQGPESDTVRAELFTNNWEIVTSESWLTVSPSSGTSSGAFDIGVTVDPSEATNGTHNGTVTFKSGGNTLGTLAVEAIVSDNRYDSTAPGVGR
jgi:hypothetical protein